jgi:hypothetical protein
MENRYSELKFNGDVHTEQWKIDEILIKNKFNWMVNAEIKNARLEIFQDTLVWNAGIWYNGDWYFGVWRDGEWRYGTWQNGVFYNGVWRNGTFKSGIIFNGKFFKGKIESGEIRGGQFIDVEISQNVKELTSDEFQEQQEEQQKQVAVQAQPEQSNQNKVKVHFTTPTQEIEGQPKIQQEKMKYIKTFENFENKFAFDDEIKYELKRYLINTINCDDRVEQLINIHKKFIDNNKNTMSANEIAKRLYQYDKNLKINK